jgi:hypothetical protein
MWYIPGMFSITKQAEGPGGAFVKLVKLDEDDYAVIIRHSTDGKLHNRYIGPDSSKAEEVFVSEVRKLAADEGTQ